MEQRSERGQRPNPISSVSCVFSAVLMGRETGSLHLLAPLLLTGGKGADLVIRGNVVLNTIHFEDFTLLKKRPGGSLQGRWPSSSQPGSSFLEHVETATGGSGERKRQQELWRRSGFGLQAVQRSPNSMPIVVHLPGGYLLKIGERSLASWWFALLFFLLLGCVLYTSRLTVIGVGFILTV
jgi:hypothetical protein